MKLADLTWLQVKEVPRENVVVIPLASLEQHSAHLPLATDSCVLEALVERLEIEAGDCVLTLPILWLAYSARHLPFKGTVSVPWSTYIEMVTATASSMVQAGFSRLLLLNGQHDNEPHLALVLRQLRERHPGVAAIALSYWTLLDETQAEEYDLPGHAGDLETSLLLHLRPNRVNMGEIARDGVIFSSKFVQKVIQYTRMDQSSHHGGIGNPEHASPEKGQCLFEQIARSLVALVQDFRDGILQ